MTLARRSVCYTIRTRGAATCGHLHRTLTGAIDCLRRSGRHARGERRAPEIRVVKSRLELVEYDRQAGPGRPIR
jgi:hypothetical protein